MERYDAIIVLGGGVRDGGELPLWVQLRLNKAIELANNTDYIIVTTAYTPHKPPVLDENGFPIFESVAMANYLIKKGINPNKILTERVSVDTIGNAYFTRLIHTDQLDLKKLLIITSDFHMPRSKAIFRFIFNLSSPSIQYQLFFESIPDNDLDPEIINPRKIKEENSLNFFLKQMENIKSLKDFHNWIFSDHKGYSSSQKQHTPAPTETLSSY